LPKLFGKEEALFVASGTMGNLIGLMVNCKLKGEGAVTGRAQLMCMQLKEGGMAALGSIQPIVV